MSKQIENQKTLKEARFVEDHKRGMWINRERRMAFSVDAVRDQLNAWVRHVAQNEVPGGKFHFYVNDKPETPDLFRITLKELGLSQLVSIMTVLQPSPN